jgi:hypothetical protein
MSHAGVVTERVRDFEQELNLCDEQFRRCQLPGENVRINSEIGDLPKEYLLMLKRCQLRVAKQRPDLDSD